MKIRRISPGFPRLLVLQAQFDIGADVYRDIRSGTAEVSKDLADFLVGAGFCEEIIEKPKTKKDKPGGDKGEVNHGD